MQFCEGLRSLFEHSLSIDICLSQLALLNSHPIETQITEGHRDFQLVHDSTLRTNTVPLLVRSPPTHRTFLLSIDVTPGHSRIRTYDFHRVKVTILI